MRKPEHKTIRAQRRSRGREGPKGREVCDETRTGGPGWQKQGSDTWKNPEVKSLNLNLFRMHWRKRAGRIFKEGAIWSETWEQNVILVPMPAMRQRG